MESLLEMLAYRRPAGSKTERAFIGKYIEPLGVQRDGYGNLIKRIGDSPVLWSCHTDTVHKQGGSQKIDVYKGFARVIDKGSNCLGADDTAGVWLMSEMIRAKREGLYVFHRAEEIGGCGSWFIASKTPALLDDVKYAVALDRRGYSDVITHQGMGRCCSDVFAESLSVEIGLRYAPDDGGIFTDTANYVDLVGECTNLSVGYNNEHTTKESLDIEHIMELRESLLGLDASKLECSRKVGEIEDYGYGGAYGAFDPWEYDQLPLSQTSIFDLVKNNPDEVADILLHYGFDAGMLRREIEDRRA